MFADSFTPPCGIPELTKHRGKKAEHHYYGESNNLTETANHQRYSKRYEYGEQPAQEQQHIPDEVVMLRRAPFLGHIPHIADPADPVFAIVLFHTVISRQKNRSIKV